MRELKKQYKQSKPRNKLLRKRYFLLLIAFVLLIIFLSNPNVIDEFEKHNISTSKIEEKEGVENGIHVQTGFVDGEGLNTVIVNCTGCHSSQLVIQNRMNKERWNATIRWMQETQNLWDLGENQKVIVDYLVTNYPPIEKGRRMNLKDVDWYVLEE